MRTTSIALALGFFPLLAQSLSPVLTETTVKHPGPMKEFQLLTKARSRKVPHSMMYQKAWKRWSMLAMDHIRYDLSQNLPHPVDADATEKLELQLGPAADVGEMPSFADAGSRSGYALDFLACRVRRLSDTLLLGQPECEFLEQSLAGFFEQNTCRVASIGGGPGYDYVGICLAAAFMNRGPEEECVSIQGTVFDYETGWKDLVESMDRSTTQVLSNVQDDSNQGHSCSFGGHCDITKSLDEPTNHACREVVNSTEIFVCQYCVAENANLLRESEFVFFRDLFDRANEGSLFIVTEATHRLWPDFVNLLLGGGFEVAFIKNRSLQLVIRKRRGAEISPQVQLSCSHMVRDAAMHTLKLKGGYSRQLKKVRGAK